MRLGETQGVLGLVLVLIPVFTVSRQNVLTRNQLQSEFWWRVPQSVSGWGPFRSYPQSLSSHGSSWNNFGEGEQSKQQEGTDSPISVICGGDRILVTVQRDLYGNGRLVKASDLALGPQSCKPAPQSTDNMVVFENGLQECGNVLEVNADLLVYSTILTYRPSSDSPIIRTDSAVVPVKCYYPRHGNVSSQAMDPTWDPFSSTLSSEERMSFSLRLMDDDWSSPRLSNVFQLGEVFYIEASVNIRNHVAMRVFVDKCVATVSSDAKSNPSYEIIALNGCLVDGTREDSSSAFRSPRPQVDKIQFMVDAFRFIGMDSPLVFITCVLRAVATNEPLDALNKACTFSKTSSTWSSIDGHNNICSCCEMKSCESQTSQSRRVRPTVGSRHRWKREYLSGKSVPHEQTSTLGPLIVVGPEGNTALYGKMDSHSAEVWVVAAVGFLWVVVLSVIVLAWKMNPKERHILYPQ
ncbi:zona pellucida sperm-binding protein 3-like [Mixophyes fleayi]|uniref:zona pellucida sperm-binding protein 3-like n=1 Tax=Mixophyes fleayi TaxID=3061075 RepID=UPI003F4E023F